MENSTQQKIRFLSMANIQIVFDDSWQYLLILCWSNIKVRKSHFHGVAVSSKRKPHALSRNRFYSITFSIEHFICQCRFKCGHVFVCVWYLPEAISNSTYDVRTFEMMLECGHCSPSSPQLNCIIKCGVMVQSVRHIALFTKQQQQWKNVRHQPALLINE